MTIGSREFKYSGTSGARLDRVVLEYCTELTESVSRSQIKSWIAAGAVRVDGNEVCKAGFQVKVGAVIAFSPPEVTSPFEPYEFPLEILHEDSDLIAINKPPGITVHPGAGSENRTVLNALLHHFGGSAASVERHGIVHRLDKDTSGVLLVAKSSEAHRKLSRQFAERAVHKIYRALLLSPPRRRIAESGRIEAPIGRHPTRRTEMAVIEGGRAAVTNWSAIERMNWACLVDVRPESGRTHQIRVHCRHIDHPIVGDHVYGADRLLPEALRRETARFGRQALHAYAIEFIHPLREELVRIAAELPEDFEKLLEAFRRESGF